MIVDIHRGQNQIGGSIIELSTANTRIIFDVGLELDETEEVKVPDIEGLFYGDRQYDAVFISHYHADHMGLLSRVLDGTPIYMGQTAYKMVCAASKYMCKPVGYLANFIKNQCPISIGDFTITPILCDHSAYDAYMFLIAAEGKTILYSGDFRANGRLESDMFFHELPTVDALIIEGTTLSRIEQRDNIQEEHLERIAVEYLKKHKGPAFIVMSAMNIDRLITARNIADQTGRIFLEDLYTAEIAAASGNDRIIPNPENRIRVFMTGGDKQYEHLLSFGDAKIGKKQIAAAPFVMCVRPTMQSYLSKLNEICSFEDGVLFYGMWKGYLEKPNMKSFINFMRMKGVQMHILHTSGHADEKTIERLIETVRPKIIIPVHTENPLWFRKYEPQIKTWCDKGAGSI